MFCNDHSDTNIKILERSFQIKIQFFFNTFEITPKNRIEMQSNLHSTTGNKYVRSLIITHTILLLGLLGFAGVTLFLNSEKMEFTFDTQDTFLLIFPVIAISALAMVKIVPQKMIEAAKSEQKLITKLSKYQSATIIKYFIIEGPAILGMIFFLVTKNATFIAIAGALIAFFILQRPTKEKIESELALRGEDRDVFRNGDREIS